MPILSGIPLPPPPPDAAFYPCLYGAAGTTFAVDTQAWVMLSKGGPVSLVTIRVVDSGNYWIEFPPPPPGQTGMLGRWVKRCRAPGPYVPPPLKAVIPKG